ncbi:MAG TPA: transcription elongation factor GreA [Lachnospiraceae bacterium]|jgi:transcription elongation factor GreA|nr:transcription elongation factor GreA [Lachnospiraceae bacterium]MDD6148145.1 transcription elongation factor GreA [Lachnospiraceae bacterium]MDY5705172.1 transcription elongation factor GreA [Lachnospiraceae bacterium]MEE3356892.1 transcription elongation factor GreA [Lachnospiraceae bacterium]HAN50639.1 transcription elongation factor GreA [Lachnospiraceae bacterium]
MASRQKLTPSDVEKIQAEIRNRKVNIRHEILEEVKEARAQGDYSENYELYAAKRAKNQNESRIRYLEGILKNAIIISDESTDGQVSMNNLVTIYFPEDDLEETYKITTSIRSNSSENRLDMESPLGKALLHHKVGDTVTVHVNKDISYDVVIRAIDDSQDGDDAIQEF